jgi:transcriptional regulator with GAF, ATPase, and Fis domain
VEALRGTEILRHDFGIKDLSEYIAADIKNFDKPIIRKHLPPHSKTHKKAAYLHIPITRGKLIRGVLTVSASSAKCFKRFGPDNFLIIARLIEQLYDNSDRNNQLLNMARKVNEKVDVTTDELTKTNLRLIDRVKEMKSLYDLSRFQYCRRKKG